MVSLRTTFESRVCLLPPGAPQISHLIEDLLYSNGPIVLAGHPPPERVEN
jgi:hypothetical protein